MVAACFLELLNSLQKRTSHLPSLDVIYHIELQDTALTAPSELSALQYYRDRRHSNGTKFLSTGIRGAPLRRDDAWNGISL